MSLDFLLNKDFWEGAKDCATTFGIVVGGYWTLRLFINYEKKVRDEQNRPLVQVSVQGFVSKNVEKGVFAVRVFSKVENLSKVPSNISLKESSYIIEKFEDVIDTEKNTISIEIKNKGQVPVSTTEQYWITRPGLSWEGHALFYLEPGIYKIKALFLMKDPEYADHLIREFKKFEVDRSKDNHWYWTGSTIVEVK